MQHSFDVLILGSGAAGLTLALRLDPRLSVAVICKDELVENSTRYAQGGIAAVLERDDTFAGHIHDTLVAGAGICDPDAVAFTVENAPESIRWLIDLGINFTSNPEHSEYPYHLTREGGHSHRRIIHSADSTGKDLEETLTSTVRKRANVSIFEHHIAIDLYKKGERCCGAYIYNEAAERVDSFAARVTAIATGGASRVYLYSSNPSVSSGDGIAMGYRAGCVVENMEFNQFHPTCLYNAQTGSSLITEAMRGEGAKLLLPDGTRFMPAFDERAELAPRDIVARAIDYEIKRLGIRHVLLDISHKPADFITSHFPGIYKKCLEVGIDITREPIPVVPAAHYTCGGLKVDRYGRTNLAGLYALGEASCTGLHGANRLASNSLLECLVYGASAAKHIDSQLPGAGIAVTVPEWDDSRVNPAREEVLLLHNWEEIRRLMWNYVGIVRSDERLKRAKNRIEMLKPEIHDYYSRHRVNRNFIELRHLIVVAELIVDAAMRRRQSVGLHYNIDCPAANSNP
ncbi:MAG TPA: L-aspartate oxidase [Candidatus Rifleibacterium sp.]|nr:L-aspartate oxidase [Candidatus Rifleibacterium sp.]HPT47604.1 L-aspartate oxidase [Candidatus Rifleibacterium sp.]